VPDRCEAWRRLAYGSRLGPWLLLAALLTAWVLWYPPSPDLAAQVYRVHLFTSDGFSLWDDSWYGGHYLPGYSLLFPPVASLLGVRLVGALAVAASSYCVWRILRHRGDVRVTAATTLFVIGACGDLFIGRLTFALGIAAGAASVLALLRRHRWLCGLLSLACAAASPVAAAFLILVACGDLLTNRARFNAVVMLAPALTLTVVLVLLFPEQGYEPFALSSLLAALAACAAVLFLVPRREALVRCTAALYAIGLLLAYLVRSPMGSNAVRFGVLFAAPTLAALVRGQDVHDALLGVGRLYRRLPGAAPRRHARSGDTSRAAGWALAVTIAAVVVWQVTGPLGQSVGASLNPAGKQSFYVPVIRYLESRAREGPMRIEVPPTSSHWDAAFLGSDFLLARGWERQLDTRYDGLFYEGPLSPDRYDSWLRQNGVRFVALANAPLDYSAVREATLIRSGLNFLRLVFETSSWHVYEVRHSASLTSGPGYLTSLRGDEFRIHATRAGPLRVLVHYTPFWAVTSGDATVSEAAGGWTTVVAYRPGPIAVDADFG
jgi:hypothetical protein